MPDGNKDGGPRPELRGRGHAAMVPERGIPFDVDRRRGRGTPIADTPGGDEATLRRTPAARLFASFDWEAADRGPERPAAAGGAPSTPPPLHRRSAVRVFASFPWDG